MPQANDSRMFEAKPLAPDAQRAFYVGILTEHLKQKTALDQFVDSRCVSIHVVTLRAKDQDPLALFRKFPGGSERQLSGIGRERFSSWSDCGPLLNKPGNKWSVVIKIKFQACGTALPPQHPKSLTCRPPLRLDGGAFRIAPYPGI